MKYWWQHVMKALRIKFEVSSSDKSPYDPDFIAKINKSRQDFKAGKGKVIKPDELDEL